MNFKFALVLLFIGASSATFIGAAQRDVLIKKSFEASSKPLFLSFANKKAQKQDDIVGQLEIILVQIIIEYQLLGEIVTVSLLEDLQSLLSQVELTEEQLNAAVAFIEQYQDVIPQNVLDILSELGIAPAAPKQDDIIGQLEIILVQIIIEYQLLGEIVTVSLLEDLQSLLSQVELTEEQLNAAVAFIEQYQDVIPQNVLDILSELGIAPAAPKQDDIVGQLEIILVQIIMEYQLLGEIVTVSLLEDLQSLLGQLELTDEQLNQLVAFIQQYQDVIPQEALDILNELGILPAVRMRIILAQLDKALRTSMPKDIWQEIVDALMLQLVDILDNLEAWEAQIADQILTQLENFVLSIMAEGGISWDNLMQIINNLSNQLGDFLGQIGIGGAKKTPAEKIDALLVLMKKALSTKDIWEDLLNAVMEELVLILVELQAAGIEVSPETLADIEDFILGVMAEGGAAWDTLLALLEEYSYELNEVLGELLGELGLLPKNAIAEKKIQGLLVVMKKALSTKDIWGDLLNAVMEELVLILVELQAAGIEVSPETLADIEDFILGVMAEGGAAWDTLLALLEEYSYELNEVLGELLGELGLLPKKSATEKLSGLVVLMKKTLSTKDIWEDLLNAVMEELVLVLAELQAAGIEVSPETLADIENFILGVMAEGGAAWDTLLALLEEYSYELNEVLGELLGELGIIP